MRLAIGTFLWLSLFAAEVWSFTTGSCIAVHANTRGRLKQIYR